MCIVATEACHDDGRFVRDIIAVSVLHEKEIGCVRDPDSTVANSDAGWNIEPLGKDLDCLGQSIAVFVLKDLDFVASRARFTARILEAFSHIDAASVIERHGNWILQRGFGSHQFDPKSWWDRHLCNRLLWSQWPPRWCRLPTWNKVVCLSRESDPKQGNTNNKATNVLNGSHFNFLAERVKRSDPL